VAAKLPALKQRAVIEAHDRGRARAVAGVAFLREVLFIYQDGTLRENADFFAKLPDDLRRRGPRESGFAWRSEDAPPLIRPNVPNLLAMNEEWSDGLRRNEVRLKKLAVEIEKTRAALATAFERDLAQALGSDKLAADEFQVQAAGVDLVKAQIDAKARRKSIPRVGSS
jgi:hypothetical protein